MLIDPAHRRAFNDLSLICGTIVDVGCDRDPGAAFLSRRAIVLFEHVVLFGNFLEHTERVKAFGPAAIEALPLLAQLAPREVSDRGPDSLDATFKPSLVDASAATRQAP